MEENGNKRFGPPIEELDGIASIHDALEYMEFPISRKELMTKAGDRVIQFKEGVAVLLGETLKNIEEDEFSSAEELARRIHEAQQKKSA